MRIAGALLVAVAVSVRFRTGDLNAGFWIDEGIAVGIASHPLADIPALLRADGSPPLYYPARFRSTVRAEIFSACRPPRA